MGEAPFWLAGSALGGAVVMKVIDWFLGRKSAKAAEGGASVLIQSLTDRIVALEARQLVIESRLAEEMKMRLSAQEETSRLKVRVLHLEHTLRQADIPIPDAGQLGPL